MLHVVRGQVDFFLLDLLGRLRLIKAFLALTWIFATLMELFVAALRLRLDVIETTDEVRVQLALDVSQI